jgi:hypothetical protein
MRADGGPLLPDIVRAISSEGSGHAGSHHVGAEILAAPCPTQANRAAISKREPGSSAAAQAGGPAQQALSLPFGLAANYTDALSLPQQTLQARTAIWDVHTFTFGNEQGRRHSGRRRRTARLGKCGTSFRKV